MDTIFKKIFRTLVVSSPFIAMTIGMAYCYEHTGARWDKKTRAHTIEYYHDHKDDIQQLYATLKTLWLKSGQCDEIRFIRRSGEGPNMSLCIDFYTVDTTSSDAGLRRTVIVYELTGAAHKIEKEKNAEKCSKQQKTIADNIVRSPEIKKVLDLITRSAFTLVAVYNNGLCIYMDGPSQMEHHDNEYSMIAMPFIKDILVEEGTKMTATVDTNVYLYERVR